MTLFKKFKERKPVREVEEEEVEYIDDVQDYDYNAYIYEEEYPEEVFDLSEEPVFCTPQEEAAGVCFGQYYTGGDYEEVPEEDDVVVVRDDSLPDNPASWAPIPQLDVGPIVNQSPTPTCWANAFCALWYHEMKKRDPQCEFPSPLWIVSNRYIGCGNKGNAHEAFRIANKIGMLPLDMFAPDKRNPILPANGDPCDFASTYDRKRNKLHYDYAEKFATKLPKVTINSLFNDQRSCSVERGGINQDMPGSGPPTNEYDLTGSDNCGTPLEKAKKMYASIRDGFPVLLLITMNQALGSAQPGIPVTALPAPRAAGSGQHFVVACGFDIIKGEPCFKIKNSWASMVLDKPTKKFVYAPWGDNGYFWLSIKTARSWMQAINYKGTAFPVKPPQFRSVDDITKLQSSTGSATNVVPPAVVPTAPAKPLIVNPPAPQPGTTPAAPIKTQNVPCDTCVQRCMTLYKGRYTPEECKKLACKRSCPVTREGCSACSAVKPKSAVFKKFK